MNAGRIKPVLRTLLHSPPFDRLATMARGAADALSPKFPLTFPTGHFYSPLPDLQDVLTKSERLFSRNRKECAGIDLREQDQLAELDRIAAHYSELHFPEHAEETGRYYYENSYYSYGDAIILYGMLRNFKPRRVIEIGSGFSSAVMLDTDETYLGSSTKFSFIDPYPERLQTLLTDSDRTRHDVVAKPVQEVDLSLFEELGAGDILFVDSSHVVKIGSDLAHIVFEILPRLNPGVVIHFHDVFWPFEYPKGWLEAGWAWNEAYFLRAFLAFNTSFKILYFNDFMAAFHAGALTDKMPLCMKNTGGSLWLRRDI